MEIRASSKTLDRLKGIPSRLADVTFTEDDSMKVPIIMVESKDGKLVEWVRGDQVEQAIVHGYNRLIKKCPMRDGKSCIGEKCQWYVIENSTGDCAVVWSAVLGMKR